MKPLKLLFIGVTALLAVMAYTHSALARNIYVPQQYPTIQGAIDVASSGDVIIVAPGRYEEETITLAKGIALLGAHRDTTIIEGKNIDLASNCLLENFTINLSTQETWNLDAIRIYPPDHLTQPHSVVIQENQINVTGPGQLRAIYVRGAENIEIRNNIITVDNTDTWAPQYAAGIDVDFYVNYYHGVAYWPSDIRVINNTVHVKGSSWGKAIAIESSDSDIVKNNAIIPEYSSSGSYGVDAATAIVAYNAFFAGDYEPAAWGTNLGVSNIFDLVIQHEFHDEEYHLKRRSQLIDAGDPSDDYSREPMPNGDRINIGAYGNTEEAAKSLNLNIISEVPLP